MNREGFIGELRQRLSGLPQEDIEERLSFCSGRKVRDLDGYRRYPDQDSVHLPCISFRYESLKKNISRADLSLNQFSSTGAV